MLNILAAVLLFGLIVLIHEFGHFLFAKLNGIGVVEFSIGMGPRLLSTVRGETRYSIKILHFGGSCMMVGEDMGEEEGAAPDPKAFNSKPVWARIQVIAAGPVFNFILAFLFAMVIVAQIGHDTPVLYGVMEGYPAQEAGLQAGDKITRINNRKIRAHRDVSLYLYSHPGEEMTIYYERPAGGSWEQGGAAERRSVRITPVYAEEYQSHMLGVQFRGYEKTHGLAELISASAYEVGYCVRSTFDSIGMMFRRQVEMDEAVAGPVQIVTMVGETVEEGRQQGPAAVLFVLSNWILLLSASLGIMNLLPVPALDGGRLLFLFFELLRGRPVDPEKEGMVHMAGMALLMAFMVLVLFNDIRKLL